MVPITAVSFPVGPHPCFSLLSLSLKLSLSSGLPLFLFLLPPSKGPPITGTVSPVIIAVHKTFQKLIWTLGYCHPIREELETSFQEAP